MNNQIKSSRQKGAVNPLVIILILLMAIFLAVIALFIKQMTSKDSNSTPIIIDESPDLSINSQISPLPATNPPSGERTLSTATANQVTATKSAESAVISTPAATPSPTPKTTPIISNSPVSTPISNSTSTITSKNTYLRGELILSGDFPDNSTILILQKKTGESSYQVINRVNPQRNITWEWKEAETGVKYDITYALQVNNENVHTAPVATAQAPAQITTRMNTNYKSSNSNNSNNNGNNGQTTGQAWIESCGDLIDNKFQATIRMPRVSDAQQYRVLVGTSQNSQDIIDQHLDQSGDNLSLRVDLENDKSYFVRYTYATCKDCGNSFKDLSPTVEIKCRRV